MAQLLAERRRVDRGFERLYRRHVADVYHYALAVLRNPADAEDVTQTTFLNALRAYDRGERPKSAQNWLIAIAHNVCRQRFRQSQRRPREVSLDQDVADHLADDEAPNAEDIRRALGQLAFNQRAAIVMRELEGRSYADIAEILGLSSGAVETLLFRARRALREQLEGALTCDQAELAISKQLDGRLSRSERGALRAHLRACPDCATVARRQRAQRAAFKSLGAIPLPTSLASLFGGGGGAAVGTGVAAKAAAVVATGALVGGLGYEGARHARLVHRVVRQHEPAHVRASAPAPIPPVLLGAPTRPVPSELTTKPHVVTHHALRGAHRARPTHPSHPARPLAPTHPAHPIHPVKRMHPVHPAHPVHPSHPATPAAAGTATGRGRGPASVYDRGRRGKASRNGNREQAKRRHRLGGPPGRQKNREAQG
jgi:RNA polymerase sigma-70 factor, ECF subfamily